MAVDNPSYFSLQQGASNSSSTSNSSNNNNNNNNSNAATARFSGFFRRSKPLGKARTAPVLTACSQPRVPTTISPTSPPNNAGQRRSLRNLFRSASTNSDCERTLQFLSGEPRPSDIAPPSPYLNSRSLTEGRGSKYRRRAALKSSSELLNVDMVFCGLPSSESAASTSLMSSPRRTEDNDYYRFERESECGSEAATLPIDELEDERSYYNLTSTLPHSGRPSYSSMGRHRNTHSQPRVRRHSVGTFLDRERCTSVLNAKQQQQQQQQDLVVDVVDHASTANSSSGKHGTRHATSSFSTKPSPSSSEHQSTGASLARDDVVFVSSKDDEAAALWVNYLTACFEQISRQQGRPPFRVSQVSIEEPLNPNVELKIRTARLQIIVVCPMFLERVSERPEQATALSRQLSAERVLAMMLGVQDANVSAAQRANLLAYQSWRKFFVKDQDETFVGQFLGAAVAILGSANTNNNNPKHDKIGFSVHPKKVKTGQNRVLALLNEPLHADDTISVTVDRCGEALDVSQVKRRNPYTLQFAIPERCLDVSMLVGVRIARNGAPLGVRQVKCESRLRELDQILRAPDNPLEFMCQTFGFNPGDKEQLDNWMVHAFQKNIPPHFNLLSNPSGELQLSKNHSSSEENPTLLHFAARFGLEKLAWQLLECPGGDVACDMKNANDHTPADLAEQAGHVRLAHQLRGYMQMNEFSNMYSYLKVMSENANESGNDPRSQHNIVDEECRQEDYCRPRPLSEAYSVPPIARPVLPRTFPDYSTPPPLPQPNPMVQTTTTTSTTTTSENEDSATPLASYASSSTLNGSGSEIPLQGYMQMNPAVLRATNDAASSTPTTVTSLSSSQLVSQRTSSENTPTTTEPAKNEDSNNHHHHHHHHQGSNKSNRSSQSSSKSTTSRESPQDELLEIITDFKNNVFNIGEVEKLVENWRNRNDVQQSFRDKQRQLAAMRDEYERIQKRIKSEMKAPTPFDRIRKFFTKGKKDSKESAISSDDATPSKPSSVNGNLADRRPVSSLSLHSVSSSSSSGRMSTVSGCSGTSLGDSGTHSDTDDRRLQHHHHAVLDEKAGGMTSYEIPPAPKPLNAASCRLYNSGRYTPTLARSTANMGCPSVNSSELDLRPVKSSYPTHDDKEYYIAFPPCGLPVHTFKPNSASGKEPKTPSTPMDYANVLVPPPGMCIPSFQYANVSPPSADSCGNVLTVEPEIHPEPSSTTKAMEVNGNENESVDENDNREPAQPDSPKIINTEAMPDYTNVQVAASEEIARNFGVTLKKLPGPPVPPRCEFNFAAANEPDGVKANEE